MKDLLFIWEFEQMEVMLNPASQHGDGKLVDILFICHNITHLQLF